MLALKKFSARIRALSLDLSKLNASRSLDCLQAFTACAITSDLPLFPKLRRLRILGYGATLEDGSHIGVFLGDQLELLNLSSDIQPSHRNTTFFSSVTRRCPKLATLTVPYLQLDSRQLHGALSAGRMLQSVNLMISTPDDIQSLSQLSLLDNLLLSFDTTHGFPIIKSHPTPFEFPKLSTLEVNSETDLSVCHSIICCVNLPVVKDLTLRVSVLSRASALSTIRELIELISSRVGHKYLSTLSISEECDDGLADLPLVNAPDAELEDPFCLAALQVFKGLKYLRVACLVPVATGLRPLCILARSAPHLCLLEVLDVNDAAVRVKPKVKLHQIPEFLKYWPELYTLAIPIDTSDLKWHPQRPGEGYEHDRDIHLRVGSSPISEFHVHRIAAYLSDVFPDIGYLSAAEDVNPGDGTIVENRHFGTWNEVYKLTECLIKVRKQERDFYEAQEANESSEEEEEQEEGEKV